MPTAPALHPLARLTGDEIVAARELVLASGRAAVPPGDIRFAYVGLFEPPKATVRAADRGERVAVDRQLRMVLLQGPRADVVEAVVSVTRGEIDRWEVVPEVRPALQIEESMAVIHALQEHPEWNAALDRRGVVDRSLIQIDPWPAGAFGLPHEEGRRITRCLAYVRESKEDNGYARPLEGLLAFVDMGRGEVLEVADYGLTPIPPTSGSYYPEDNGPMRTDLRPLEITQPEGPSFTVEDNLIRWQKWSLRVGMDPYEGLVLWRVGYEDGERVRPVLYRASVSEMVVPYGDPSPMHAWKSAFDAGEWGLGRMANSLTLGCDCLGEIHYFDDVFSDERGKPHTRANAICLHEEDYGILWKHVDMVSGRTEVRRSRRLVVSSIATVGNYEYGFYWYFYLDGTMQLEVKLSGIMSTMAFGEEGPGDHANAVAPGLAAPYHQHLFNMRLDVEVDGPDNAVLEVDAVRGDRRVPPGTHGETPSVPRPPCSRASWRPGATRTPRAAGAGASSIVGATTPSGSRRPTSWYRRPSRRSWRTPARAWRSGPPSRPTTCGSRRSRRKSAAPPATIRTSTPAGRACRSGQLRIGRWSTPTSCCGTPSA